MTALRVGSLCTGFAALDLAIEDALGPTKLLFVADPGTKIEDGRDGHPDRWDDGPVKLLAHRYPDVPNLGDISKVDWTEMAKTVEVDVMAMGFPCTDVSLAGRGDGLIGDRVVAPDGDAPCGCTWMNHKVWCEEVSPLGWAPFDPVSDERRLAAVDALNQRDIDDHPEWLVAGNRSGVWTHCVSAIRALRPSLVVIENVGGLLSARAHSDLEPCSWCLGDQPDRIVLRALGAVLGDLAELGFDAEWVSVRASDVGAAHGRKRVFIIAWPADTASDTRRLILGNLRPAADADGRGRRSLADPAGDRWNTWRPEPARLVGRPDAAVRRGAATHADRDTVRPPEERVGWRRDTAVAEHPRTDAPADADGRGLAGYPQRHRRPQERVRAPRRLDAVRCRLRRPLGPVRTGDRTLGSRRRTARPGAHHAVTDRQPAVERGVRRVAHGLRRRMGHGGAGPDPKPDAATSRQRRCVAAGLLRHPSPARRLRAARADPGLVPSLLLREAIPMAENTAIEWTHREGTTPRTWNPTTGCDRLSAGCDHCYALTLAKRLKGMGSAKYQTDGDPRTSGPGFGVATHTDTLGDPLKWPKPSTVFVNSMSDLFHARVPRAFVARVFAVMAATPQHTYQILTKRPERMARMLVQGGQLLINAIESEREAVTLCDATWPLPNVWLGTSIESAEHIGRADHLRATPAVQRFVSAEPLLGPLDGLDLGGISWLVAGGESGPGSRPMDLDWVRSLIDLSRASGTAPFVKQLGKVWAGGGKGGDWSLWPEDLRVREYPTAVPAAA